MDSSPRILWSQRAAWAALLAAASAVAIFVGRNARPPTVTAAPPRPDVVFSDYLFTSEDALFSLTDTASQRSSGWLKIGQSFAGYTVASFDPAKVILTLQQEGKRHPLPLRAARSSRPRIFFQVKEGPTDRSGQLEFSGVELKQVVDHFAAVSGRQITVAPEIGVLKVTGHFGKTAVESFLYRLPQIVPVRVEVGADGSVQILPQTSGATSPGGR